MSPPPLWLYAHVHERAQAVGQMMMDVITMRGAGGRYKPLLMQLSGAKAVGGIWRFRYGQRTAEKLEGALAQLKRGLGITDRSWDLLVSIIPAFRDLARHMGVSPASFPPRSGTIRALGKPWGDALDGRIIRGTWKMTVSVCALGKLCVSVRL